ncbi:Rho GTPase-activating protein 22 [Dissostichus eleginoides]|uniref:Rho GTPase-activating protein 22 n=1 Tax=Dissostichus eleginoides TaxID=100907 RepID=A0AAD9CQT2_DISEL|nr:Rho GTPase-activating protein 22 [Dissostichus eleginoides]
MVLGELSRISRPCSPLDQEKTLKAGWLKRQRSIMKNWQLRWFVLRNEALYFYKDQDETKAQCSQVNELPANQDEPGRHPFEIVPGGAGEKDRTGVSHESFLLMANSQSDMEDWVRAIRRVIWAPLGGGVFGQHLEETMLYEAQCGAQRPVPLLVEQCACFIREHGLKEEGLFRAPGQTNHVRELQDAFDRGEKPVFDSTTDVHTVASLLKLYIRELPEPIIPFPKYTQFLSCAQILTKDKAMGIIELGKQVKSLPQVNYNLLTYICKFLDEVQSHSNENKMSVQNLATVFGPNILRPRVEDPVTMMEGSSQVQHLMTVLISEYTQLYQREQPETEAKIPPKPQQSPTQRGKAEWLSQQNNDPPSSKTPEEERRSSTPSTEIHRRTTSSGERLKDTLKDSTLSLKETTLPLKDTQRDSDEDCLQTPLSHRGLHQSHRLSAYDNVAPSSLSLPADTSIWTSFEISLAEPKGSEKAVILEQGKESPTEVKDSTSTLDNTASGTEDDITGTNEGLANMLTDLKQELKKQRTSYETCIRKEGTSRRREPKQPPAERDGGVLQNLGDLTTGATRTP